MEGFEVKAWKVRCGGSGGRHLEKTFGSKWRPLLRGLEAIASWDDALGPLLGVWNVKKWT